MCFCFGIGNMLEPMLNASLNVFFHHIQLSKVKRRMKYLRHQRNSAITGTKSPKKTVKTSRIRHHALTAPSGKHFLPVMSRFSIY